MQNFVIEKATQKDLNSILNITKDALNSMKAMNFNQWNEHYPNEEIFKEDIKAQELYLYKEKDEILGFIASMKNSNPNFTSKSTLKNPTII